jgi:ABC-type antimicrobial peptide transport system permease subunit
MSSKIAKIVTSVGRHHVLSTKSLREQVNAAFIDERIGASFALPFSLIACGLIVLGHVANLRFALASRRRDIATRIALGASSKRIIAEVILETTRIASVGLAAGILVALIVGRLVRFGDLGISWYDPITFLSISVLTYGAILTAGYCAGRRAVASGPVGALRPD